MLRKGLLALLSVAAGLAVCEAALRLFHPRYEFVAESVPAQDRANVYRYRGDPDTFVRHRVIYNNLGGRQSRNFPPDSLDGAVNIAFFGDSQTENTNMPAQYSYTEPLDFLLNVAAGRGEQDRPLPSPFSSKPRFNVLNFGVSAYGPGLAYLRWRNLAVRDQLAHVFYMVVDNDLSDLQWALSSGVVRLDESGALRDGAPLRPPAWKRLLARSHLAYLAIDAWRRLTARDPMGRSGRGAIGGGDTLRADQGISEDRTLRVFVALLRRWRAEVEANGGTFHVVLLPNPPNGWGANATLGNVWLPKLRERVAVLDLPECFQELAPGSDYRQWRFVNDPHWNPVANMMAATCLYRHLEGTLGLSVRTPEALANMRHAYYQAFVDSPAWEGERYMPSAAWARPPARGDTSASEAIVSRYLALEVAPPMEREWLAAVRNARTAGAVALAADWNVYVNVERLLLVYVKNPCPTNWRPAGFFFLHVVPFTRERQSAEQARLGFVNLDGGPFSPLRRMGDECVFSVPLPNYPLATAKTGRYAVAGEGGDALYTPLWQVAFAVPLARSVWDVYAGAGRRASLATRTLNYVKEPCGQADTDARFYLHVYPLQSVAPPTEITDRGYANLDFAWGEVGVKTDSACRISVPLPDFPMDFVYTGQFREGVVSSKRLWSVRVDFAEAERLRRRAGGGGA